MRQVVKHVTARELFDIINNIRRKQGLPMVTWDGFRQQIATNFLNAPSLEQRWHDIIHGVDYVYVIGHKQLREALQNEIPTTKKRPK